MFRFLHQLRQPSPATRRRPRPSRRLELECLEARLVPSIGAEFHVNTATAGSQNFPVTASSSSPEGRSVAVWVSYNDGETNLRGQLYNAQGNPMGNEFAVANLAGVPEAQPAVAMDQNGSFVVAYTRGAYPREDVVARRFNLSGQPLGSVIIVEASTSQREHGPAVAMGENGRFVVSHTLSYSSQDMVRGHLFNFSTGARLNTLRVSAPDADARDASVAMAADGRFAIAWREDSPRTGPRADIFVKRYTAAGVETSEQPITSSVNDNDMAPMLASDGAFNLVVAWTRSDSIPGYDVLARRLSSKGALGSVLTIASSTYYYSATSIAMHPTNMWFVVSYVALDLPARTEWSEVAEVSSSNVVKATHHLGNDNYAGGLSINGSGRYFIVLSSWNRPKDPEDGVFGRFGML
ncbi:MAG: hypothetical protein L0Z62_50895 [Gemmataceae bacterium]|nr:hypothetical protein [Gemmataceae bacterium]